MSHMTTCILGEAVQVPGAITHFLLLRFLGAHLSRSTLAFRAVRWRGGDPSHSFSITPSLRCVRPSCSTSSVLIIRWSDSVSATP